MRLVCSLWTRKENTAAENGVFYGWTTEADCMAACLTSPICVAIDFGPLGCVLHNNASDLITARYQSGVTQFVLNRQCLPTTPPPSATTSTAGINSIVL